MSEITLDEIAPCGVTCFACSSFIRGTCMGCRSEKKQKRTSKYSCKIRNCCINEKHLQFCNGCEELPCQKFRQKLLLPHATDPKYAYRRDTLEHFHLFQRVGLKKALAILDQRWRCPECEGRIEFYEYTCRACGRNYLEQLQNYRADLE